MFIKNAYNVKAEEKANLQILTCRRAKNENPDFLARKTMSVSILEGGMDVCEY